MALSWGIPGVRYEQDGKFYGPDGNQIGGEKEPNAYLDKEEIIQTLERLYIDHDKRWNRDRLLKTLEENVATERPSV